MQVAQGSKYATIWLNMSDVNLPEDVWIYNNR